MYVCDYLSGSVEHNDLKMCVCVCVCVCVHGCPYKKNLARLGQDFETHFFMFSDSSFFTHTHIHTHTYTHARIHRYYINYK